MIDTLMNISVIARLVLYLIAFGSSVTLAVFLIPLNVRLAKCLAGVMIGVALNVSIMAFILSAIVLRGRIHKHYTWQEFLLFIGALVIATVCVAALHEFRSLKLNER